MAGILEFAEQSLSQPQNEFIHRFLGAESKPDHLLLAPAGGGKTTTALVIAQEIVKSAAAQVLVLAPARILLDQYRQVFDGISEKVRVHVLDRKLVREIETLRQQESYWRNSIALTTWDTASRDDVSSMILSVTWGLVIADVSHIGKGTKEATLFKALFNSTVAARMLVLADPIEANNIAHVLGKKYDRLQITKWGRKDYLSLGRSARELRVEVIDYLRTKEEIAFIWRYTGLSKWLAQRRFQNRIRSRLVSSSLYAAEHSLRNLQNQLTSSDLRKIFESTNLAHELVEDEELLADASSETIDPEVREADSPRLQKEVSLALEALDKVQVDTKGNVLISTLRNTDISRSHIWIYASYRLTISYLYSLLSEAFPNVYQIHGELPSGDVNNAIRMFSYVGGIMIASTVALKGIEVPADTLILYDTPASDMLLYIVLTRLSAHPNWGTDTGCTIVALHDTSGVLVTEAKRIRKLQDIVEQSTNRNA